MVSQILTILLNGAVLVFAVSSMFAVGLAHHPKEVLYPLRNIRGVIRVLIANFVLVPLVAVLLTSAFSFRQPVETGLLLIGAGAGAPFLIKLAERAKHDLPISATLLVLLLPATVIYLPLVVPFLIESGEVEPGAIAWPLVSTMLLPLAAGLSLNYFAPVWAAWLYPGSNRTGSISLVVLIVTTVLLNLRGILSLFGSGEALAAAALTVAAFGIGYVRYACPTHARETPHLGTA